MFVDKVQVSLKAGNGGNGIVSFRHEKFIAKGGPDGGDGGQGGNIIFRASHSQNTLAAFRYNKELKAASGEAGGKRRMHGKSGQDLVVPVPVGTVVLGDNDQIIADFTKDGQQDIIALGGKGGFGNAHFVSSRRQAPRVAELGEPGEIKKLTLELKLIADVGLVGLPNGGKSTLLATISNARPQIADYPFTTLTPNLGVVDIDSRTSLLFADIPGLIEGASQGKGLGDEFLRHIERTSVLVHLIDIYQDDVAGAYKTIQKELKDYKIDLTSRLQLVVLNKIDGFDREAAVRKQTQLKKVLPAKTPIFAISAASGEGVPKLLFAVKEQVQTQRTKTKRRDKTSKLPVLRFTGDNQGWQVKKSDGLYIITGSKIERFAQRTDFDSLEGVQRLRDIMKKMGITAELERRGVQPGRQVAIGKNRDYQLEY